MEQALQVSGVFEHTTQKGNTMDTQQMTDMIDNQEKKLSPQFPQEVPNEVIETQTKKIPNLVFLGLAGASIAASLILAVRGRKKVDFANFVGQWAPTFMLFGIYNKIVKVEDEILADNNRTHLGLH
jgi:hypothetical protein